MKINFEYEVNDLPIQLRAKLQIAAEKMIIDAWVKGEDGPSSRVLADNIVDMVIDTLLGKTPLPSGDALKPWLAFGIKNK